MGWIQYPHISILTESCTYLLLKNMELSGQQLKKLQNALIDAFPNKFQLEQMLFYELDKSLDTIAGGNQLQEITLQLLKTAKAEEWVDDLVHAAYKSNPGNLKLKAFAQEFFKETYFKKVLSFQQVSTGNVNRHSLEEALEIAFVKCIRTDKESQARVAAFITALYLQFEIKRAAQVGGSLLKRFGKSWFPHIKNKELHFALKVDSELENYLCNQILNKCDKRSDE